MTRYLAFYNHRRPHQALGYQIPAEVYVAMEPLSALPSGGVWSPLLGAELRPLALPETPRRPAGVWLRVIDPWTGRPIPIAEEEHDELHVMRQQVTVEERTRLAAERLAADEKQARLAAEQRAEQAEAELQKLHALLARRQDTDSAP